MAYQRKTRDYWSIEQHTSEGWEEACAENSIKKARERVREYRENQPEYPVRMKWRRERIETCA